MKKSCKAILCLLLILLLTTGNTVFATNYKAIKPTFTVLVNGERFYSEPPVVVVDGSTYLPLRALGDCLGVYVEWNAELRQVEVSTTKEALPKEPALENGYERFDDVPDFTKVTGIPVIVSESQTTDFGYLTSFAYAITDEVGMKAYIEHIMELGFELDYTDATEEFETSLFLNVNTGRMINLVYMSNVFVVSVFEETYTLEEWVLLDKGKKLPQKQFDAVTAGFKVMVDNNEFISEKSALVIDGRTYLPLRAMGDCLGVFVDWDAENSTVIVNSSE